MTLLTMAFLTMVFMAVALATIFLTTFPVPHSLPGIAFLEPPTVAALLTVVAPLVRAARLTAGPARGDNARCRCIRADGAGARRL